MEDDIFDQDICITLISDLLSSVPFSNYENTQPASRPWKANGPSQIRLTASKRLPASSVVLPT